MKLNHIITAVALAAAFVPASAQLRLDDGTATSPYFIAGNDTVELTSNNDFTTIPIATNADYSFSLTTSSDWITIKKEPNGNLAVFSDFNYMPAERCADILLASRDGQTVRTLVVRQAGNAASDVNFTSERDKYFSDKLCTQLLPTVSEADLYGITNTTLRSVATQLLHGSYDTKYRVDTFKAMYNLRDLQSELKTSYRFSSRENPTGIYFKKGATVGVVCENIGTKTVQLQVRNFGPEEFASSTYALHDGLNVITPTNNGNGYVFYFDTKTAFPTDPEIGVHFLNGIQNGFYNLAAGETNDDYKREIAAAQGDCFDFLGKYCIVSFPLDQLRANCPNGQWNASTFDSISYYEFELLGLFKYNRFYGNHQTITTVARSGGLYHANDDGCCIPYSALAQAVTSTPSYFDFWGMAHELGHNCQTNGVLWIGLTEVTNNLMSAYVEHRLRPDGFHRLENESRGFRYYDYFNKGIMQKHTLVPWVNRDVFVTLCPFFNLLCWTRLGRTPDDPVYDAYPEMYERMRNNSSLNSMNDGQKQVNFVKEWCDVTKTDFTDFFVQTGFLLPVDEMIGDYANRQLTITQQMIDDAKAYIASKNYPKAPAGMVYIDTRNAYAFVNQVTVPANIAVGTGCSVSGTTVTIQHESWPNVVGFKTYDANGNLIYMTNYGHGYRGSANNYNPTYTECEWPSNASYITAVSYDGSEVRCYQR